MFVGGWIWERGVGGRMVDSSAFSGRSSVGVNSKEIIFKKAGVPESDVDLRWRPDCQRISITCFS